MSSLSPEELLDEIFTFHPCPSEEYSSAVWYQEMMYLFEALLGEFAIRHHGIIDEILREELVSETYCLYTPIIPVRMVDVEKLRSELPGVFDSVVHLRCSDAQRFIGRRRLYELARETAGVARVEAVQQVTLGDLSRELPRGEFERFVLVVNKPGKTLAALRGEDDVLV